MQMTVEGVTLEATRISATQVVVSVLTDNGSQKVDMFRDPSVKERPVENGRDADNLILSRLLKRVFADKKNSIENAVNRSNRTVEQFVVKPIVIDYDEANKRLAYRRQQAMVKREQSAAVLESLGVKVISA
jgi:hypothetical protein